MSVIIVIGVFVVAIFVVQFTSGTYVRVRVHKIFVDALFRHFRRCI